MQNGLAPRLRVVDKSQEDISAEKHSMRSEGSPLHTGLLSPGHQCQEEEFPHLL